MRSENRQSMPPFSRGPENGAQLFPRKVVSVLCFATANARSQSSQPEWDRSVCCVGSTLFFPWLHFLSNAFFWPQESKRNVTVTLFAFCANLEPGQGVEIKADVGRVRRTVAADRGTGGRRRSGEGGRRPRDTFNF